MAKVMISMPDDLLEKVDEAATRRGTSRSGFLQELAKTAVSIDYAAREKRVRQILDRARDHGGNVAELVARDRRSH